MTTPIYTDNWEVITEESLIRFTPGELLTWNFARYDYWLRPGGSALHFFLLAAQKTPAGGLSWVRVDQTPEGNVLGQSIRLSPRQGDRLLYVDRLSREWCVCACLRKSCLRFMFSQLSSHHLN